MPRYDYICAADHVREARVGYYDEVIECPDDNCNQVAVRLPSYEGQSLVMDTGPTQYRRAEVPRDERNMKPGYDLYREASMEMDHAARKVEDSTGREVRLPMWQTGLNRARKLAKRGMTPSLFRERSHA